MNTARVLSVSSIRTRPAASLIFPPAPLAFVPDTAVRGLYTIEATSGASAKTQSINVQPKGSDMPAYEVKSPDGARSRSGSNSGAETNTAPRVWNVMKF